MKAVGTVAPARQGGDQRSGRIEAEAAFLLGELESRADITLAELQGRLAAERGLHVGIGTLWRFLRRHRMTLKKRRRMPASRTARMS
jgi:transposase